MTIQELCVKHGTDKTPEIAHDYAPVYDELFKYRKDIETFLEIGIGYPELMGHVKNYKTGASLYVWRDYFKKATIHAIDVAEGSLFTDERIKTYLCDQGSIPEMTKLAEQIGPFDIVVDDGSHLLWDQIISFKILQPYMKKGGLYFIEDCLHWADILYALKTYNIKLYQWEDERPEALDNKLILIKC